jgi:hypothetical protein
MESDREHSSSQLESFYKDVIAAYTLGVRLKTLEMNGAIPIVDE